MCEKTENKGRKVGEKFSRIVGLKAERKLKARRNTTNGIWFGLGMMGIIGWSVTIPTMLGVAIGVWVDNHFKGSYSWTLMLMVIGLAIGCLNAWHWVSKEGKEIQKEQEGDNDN
jgi:ATP synthase protein I